MLTIWKLYCRDTRGNFAIMFSVVIGLLMLAIAVVIETSRMHATRGVLQDIADSSALAGAFIAKADPDNREQAVRDNIRFHENYIPDVELAEKAFVNFNDETELLEVNVAIPRSLDSFFGGILGRDKLVVVAKSVVSYKSEAVDPVSIAFALDVSGSMGDNTDGGAIKIDVLKQSTKLLFSELEEASERPDLLTSSVRTGMSAYNTDLVSTESMRWGWTHLENSVDTLIANGGTNSTPALTNAYDQLKFDRTVRQSNDPKFQMNTLREYVVFMTDGDNNQPVWDEESAEVCETMRADGVEIYSIAFTAPEKGQLLLLNCASWNNGTPPEDYEDDDENDSDDGADDNDNENIKDKCMNNGSKGKGKALGLCKKVTGKSDYYFDAEDAATFKAAFANIGKEIAQNTIRIKS